MLVKVELPAGKSASPKAIPVDQDSALLDLRLSKGSGSEALYQRGATEQKPRHDPFLT